MLAVMDAPGQWAGGFRAWDEHGVYLATGRGAAPGRMLRVPADALRELADAWFPFGVHLIQGLVSTVREIESVARQRESLVALGTLAAGLAHEINNPASAATRAADALRRHRAGAAVLAGPAGRRDLRRPARRARRAAPGDPAAAAGASDPLAVADREDALSDWLDRHGVEPGLAHRAAVRRRRRGRRLVRAGAARCSPAARWSPGWSGWRASLSMSDAAGRGARSPPRRISDLVGAVPVLLAARPRLAAADRRRRGAGEHAGDARPQAPGRGRPWSATTAPTCPGSRRTPASSTRSGRT